MASEENNADMLTKRLGPILLKRVKSRVGIEEGTEEQGCIFETPTPLGLKLNLLYVFRKEKFEIVPKCESALGILRR